MIDSRRLRASVDRFFGKTVLVLGDLIADEYIYGKPTRISREAPVLILRYDSREVRLGGAANASHNVHTLGARVIPLGLLGDDAIGAEVTALFGSLGIPGDGVIVTGDRRTPVKTRIMAGGYQSTRQQVVRVDREPADPVGPALEGALLERLQRWGPRADAILLSDYGYGTVTPRLLEAVMEGFKRIGQIVTADSRYDLLRFRGVTAAAPNEPELEELVGYPLNDEPALEKAGRQLLERLDAQFLLVTRGSRGMALLEREGPPAFLPIHGSDEIADVTGAGDTVISTFTLALAGGAAPLEAAWLANVAGGLAVLKRGTATVTRAELLASLGHDGSSGHASRGGASRRSLPGRGQASCPGQRMLRPHPRRSRPVPPGCQTARGCAPRGVERGRLSPAAEGAGPAGHDRGGTGRDPLRAHTRGLRADL
jgi:rfaE bifunctional protein kinase chain/domain